jgi:PTS system mannose-specific IIB component
MIVLYRIDDRLLHGQVVEGWLPQTKANCVVLVNDELAKDLDRQHIVTLALPREITTYFYMKKDAVNPLKKIAFDDTIKALTIMAGPQDLLDLLELGLELPSVVNVGGLHYGLSRVSLGRFVPVEEKDRKALMQLKQMGIQLDGRSTPWDEPVDLLSGSDDNG